MAPTGPCGRLHAAHKPQEMGLVTRTNSTPQPKPPVDVPSVTESGRVVPFRAHAAKPRGTHNHSTGACRFVRSAPLHRTSTATPHMPLDQGSLDRCQTPGRGASRGRRGNRTRPAKPERFVLSAPGGRHTPDRKVSQPAGGPEKRQQHTVCTQSSVARGGAAPDDGTAGARGRGRPLTERATRDAVDQTVRARSRAARIEVAVSSQPRLQVPVPPQPPRIRPRRSTCAPARLRVCATRGSGLGHPHVASHRLFTVRAERVPRRSRTHLVSSPPHPFTPGGTSRARVVHGLQLSVERVAPARASRHSAGRPARHTDFPPCGGKAVTDPGGSASATGGDRSGCPGPQDPMAPGTTVGGCLALTTAARHRCRRSERGVGGERPTAMTMSCRLPSRDRRSVEMAASATAAQSLPPATVSHLHRAGHGGGKVTSPRPRVWVPSSPAGDVTCCRHGAGASGKAGRRDAVTPWRTGAMTIHEARRARHGVGAWSYPTSWTAGSDNGHERLPGDGHVAARWRS